MNLSAPATGERLLVNYSSDAVLDVIGRIRAANEEIDPFLIESEDEGRPYDRRKARRIQLRMPVVLIPVEEDRDRDDVMRIFGPEQIAMTRDFSSQGLGILHDELLLTDFAVVQFDIPGEAPGDLLYEIRWSVRKTPYSYMSGGRLTGIVEPIHDES